MPRQLGLAGRNGVRIKGGCPECRKRSFNAWSHEGYSTRDARQDSKQRVTE